MDKCSHAREGGQFDGPGKTIHPKSMHNKISQRPMMTVGTSKGDTKQTAGMAGGSGRSGSTIERYTGLAKPKSR